MLLYIYILTAICSDYVNPFMPSVTASPIWNTYFDGKS